MLQLADGREVQRRGEEEKDWEQDNKCEEYICMSPSGRQMASTLA